MTVKLSKIAPPWDQLETGVRLMQVILAKILNWDFILSLVYTGFHFIQDSVEVQWGFTIFAIKSESNLLCMVLFFECFFLCRLRYAEATYRDHYPSSGVGVTK